MLKPLLVIVALLLTVRGCDLPRDPERTLDRVRGTTLWAGITENKPWAVPTATGAEGVEARLVQEMAAAIGARVEWVKGPLCGLLKRMRYGRFGRRHGECCRLRAPPTRCFSLSDRESWQVDGVMDGSIFRDRTRPRPVTDPDVFVRLEDFRIGRTSISASQSALFGERARAKERAFDACLVLSSAEKRNAQASQ